MNTPQVHFESFVFRLAPTTSLNCTRTTFEPVSLHFFFSCLNWQTTQALLATSKLPQPLVYLIHIAATPAIRCCSVTGAHWEARPLVLTVLVRNGRGWVASQEQGHPSQWNSVHQAAGATYRQGVGKGSYNCSSMFILVCTLYIPVCTWYKHVYPVLCLCMVYLGSLVSAGNISVMYTVCTHLYSAVPALNNAMVQESATAVHQCSSL